MSSCRISLLCLCFASLCIGASIRYGLDLGDPTADAFVDIPSLGSAQGLKRLSYFSRKEIFGFLGINYALPPSGDLRFLPPQPFGPWEGVYNATKMRQRCPQVDISYYPTLDPDLIEQKADVEDCLVVNVFTPKLPKTDRDVLLPVLFYIHGGSFYAGSAYDFLPDFLLEKDIVLVVIQYRLGVLGFSSLQTDEIPGNAGMLDIIEALHWVNSNIRYFGGDRTRVTVVGQSAGAAAASALLVSPLVKEGLFSQVVLQSGSVLAPWAVCKDPAPLTQKIAELAGCYSTNLQEIADCMRKVPAENLVTAHMTYLQMAEIGASPQATSLVVQTAGARKFLVEAPYQLFEEGKFLKMPMMGGTTRDEGTSFLAEFYTQKSGERPEYFRRNVTRDTLKFCGAEDRTQGIVDLYQTTYFHDVSSIISAVPALVDLIGVLLMKAPTFHSVRRMSLFQPSFIYSFNFPGNVSKLAASEPTWSANYPFPTGVAHSDELGYLFPMIEHDYTERELKMVKTMVNLWTNFVTRGRPAPTPEISTWEPVSGEFGPYLRIDQWGEQQETIFTEYEVVQKEGFINAASFMRSSAIQITVVVFSITQLIKLII